MASTKYVSVECKNVHFLPCLVQYKNVVELLVNNIHLLREHSEWATWRINCPKIYIKK